MKTPSNKTAQENSRKENTKPIQARQHTTTELSEDKMNQVRYFKDPIPVREISLVTNKYFTKNKLAIAFTESVVSSIPKEMSAKNKKKNILDIR